MLRSCALHTYSTTRYPSLPTAALSITRIRNRLVARRQQDYDLYRTPVLGGTAQLLVKDIDSNPSFSPDGQHFVFERSNDPEPGKVQRAHCRCPGDGPKDHCKWPAKNTIANPLWSPDGKTVVGLQIGRSRSALVALNPNDGTTRIFYESNDTILQDDTWLPSGKGLVVIYRGSANNFIIRQVGIITYPEGILHTVTADTNDYLTPSVSSDGTSIAAVMMQNERSLFRDFWAGDERLRSQADHLWGSSQFGFLDPGRKAGDRYFNVLAAGKCRRRV